MDWLKTKLNSESVPSLEQMDKKVPWVKEFYNKGKDLIFEANIVNRVLICRNPLSTLPGIPENTDLYFYTKGWKKQNSRVLYASYNGNAVNGVDFSIVHANDIDIPFYKVCDKKSLTKPDIRNYTVINKALKLSEQKYDKVANNCGHLADQLVKEF